MDKNDKHVAEIISRNLHAALAYKQKTSPRGRCEHCNQCLPHYTQEWLAEQIGVKKATILHYLQGNRPPSISRLMKMAKALDVSWFVLLDGLDHLEGEDV
jgi:DNA-binding XRE family transcriptional regulator